jgi:hypothetical protein
MPAKKAAKKATKKPSAKMHRGKSLNSVKPLTETITFEYGGLKQAYTPQKP